MKVSALFRSILFIFFLISSIRLSAQSYDFSISNVTLTQPAISAGGTINTGTSLDQLAFDVTNSGSNTVVTGTVITVTLTVGSNNINLQGSLSAPLVSGASTTFSVDCTPAGINYDFPSSTGQFSICVRSTYTNDPVSSNNNSCSNYTMSSGPQVDLTVVSSSIEVTDPTGISIGGNIPLGSAFNQLRFDIRNDGNIGLGAGSSITLVTECAGVSRSANFTLSSNLLAGASTTLTANLTAAALNLDFPSSQGQFDICVTASTSLDNNPSNDKGCQTYTMQGQNLPTVTNMSPNSGPVGTRVTLTGSNFATSGNSVTFTPNVQGTIISSSATSVVVDVPSGAQTGAVELTTAGYAVQAGTFTITNPNVLSISSIAPNGGVIGAEVRINGTAFSTTAANNTVVFNGNATAVVKSATQTQLIVDVPAGATTGLVRVTVGGSNAFSPQSFTVFSQPQIVISSVSPSKGAIGQHITIEGDLFNSTPSGNVVTFGGGVQGTVINGNTKKLIVEVPTGAMDGTITVNNGTNSATSPLPFTIENSPIITELLPAKGMAGSTMVIQGFNFSSVDTENKVLFGSIDAGVPIVNNTQTELELTVPPGLSLGKHTVRLTVTGYPTVTADEKFEVLNENVGIDEMSISATVHAFQKEKTLWLEGSDLIENAELTIRIYNLTGALEFQTSLTPSEKTISEPLSCHLESGIYILEFEQKGTPIRQKIAID